MLFEYLLCDEIEIRNREDVAETILTPTLLQTCVGVRIAGKLSSAEANN